jgi:hypothetical protein
VIEVRPAEQGDLPWIRDLLDDRWGGQEQVENEAVTRGRFIKPTIPLATDDGTPITDEWVYERSLD